MSEIKDSDLQSRGDRRRKNTAVGNGGERSQSRVIEPQALPSITDKLLYTPTQAASTLSISRAKLYELLATQEIPSIRIGRSRRVPSEALRRWIDRLMEA